MNQQPPPPGEAYAVMSSNPNLFSYSQFAGLVSIGCSIISAFTITSLIIINEYNTKRKKNNDMSHV